VIGSTWESLAASPQALDDALVAIAGQVSALALSDEQAHWRPSLRAWSACQCVLHLAEANRVYAEQMAKAADLAPLSSPEKAAFRAGLVARWFLDQLEPPPRRRLPAPRPIVPASDRSWPDTRADFARSQATVLDLLRQSRSRGLDLNRVRFHNPFLPLLHWTVAVGFLVIETHERRHLWQIHQLMKLPDFPQVAGSEVVSPMLASGS
jgi:hypothetical protein